MDGGDGWRVRGCSSDVKDRTIINRIMLRFRPIAPKPVNGDSSSGQWNPESKSGWLNKERKKRKYVRVKKKNNSELYHQTRKNKMITISSPDQGNEKEREKEDRALKLTLQLLPGDRSADLIEEKRSESVCSIDNILGAPVQENKDRDSLPVLFDIKNQLIYDMGSLGMSDPMTPKRTVETRVTVESVTERCMDMVTLGSTDDEKIRNLEEDTCPGFISDVQNRVQWVNDAYKKTVRVAKEYDGESPEITVDLVIKDKYLLYFHCFAFTCWVRLQYTLQKEKCLSHSVMVPCDVWKMGFGGFAWRLDVKAALSLGVN